MRARRASANPIYKDGLASYNIRSYTALMRLTLKLRKVGNSVGVVLPKEALAHLRVDEGDTINVVDAADGSLRVSAHDPEFARQMDVAKDIVRRYRNAFRELAK
jgi:putative addiction module antidote